MAEVYNGNVPGLNMDLGDYSFTEDLSRFFDFNGDEVARSDWRRAEQSANNALARDMYYLNQANAFNAEEAEKARLFEERMSNTAYQRAIADMKTAGINPIVGLGLSNNGASVPSGSSASSVSSRSSAANGGSRSSSGMNVISSVLSLLAGLLTKGTSQKAMLAASALSAEKALEGKKYQADMGLKRDNAWRDYYDLKRKKNRK